MNLEDHQALLRLAGHGSSAMKPRPPIVTDYDVLKRHFRFAWRKGEDDDDSTWGARMAKRYFDKLHKEFVLADLSRWKEGKVGLRWRVEREVVDGTGQYACGSLGLGCRARESLASYELNFRYREKGEVRNELVKVRLCPDCKNLLDQARGGKGGLGAGRKERDRGKKKRRGDVRGRSESQEGRESKKERREGGRDKERAPTMEAEEGVRTQDVPQGLKGGASIRESVGAEMLAAAPSSLEVKGKASREKAMAEMDALIEDILRDGKDT